MRTPKWFRRLFAPKWRKRIGDPIFDQMQRELEIQVGWRKTEYGVYFARMFPDNSVAGTDGYHLSYLTANVKMHCPDMKEWEVIYIQEKFADCLRFYFAGRRK